MFLKIQSRSSINRNVLLSKTQTDQWLSDICPGAPAHVQCYQNLGTVYHRSFLSSHKGKIRAYTTSSVFCARKMSLAKTKIELQ